MEFNLSQWVGEWVGIATSVVKLGYWLKDRRLGRKQSKGDYFTVTCSSDSIEFKGRVTASFSAEEVLQKLLDSVRKEQKREDKPKLIDSVEGEQKHEGKSK